MPQTKAELPFQHAPAKVRPMEKGTSARIYSENKRDRKQVNMWVLSDIFTRWDRVCKAMRKPKSQCFYIALEMMERRLREQGRLPPANANKDE